MMRTTETSGDDYRFGTRSDIGLKRQRNEDFLVVRRTRYGLLAVVCDGMGGHVGGDKASSLAAEVFARRVEEAPEGSDVEDLLQRALVAANSALAEAITAEPALVGMGTTLVAALLQGSHTTVINIGDSRAYLFHDRRIGRITDDHSLVGEMVRRGEITEAEAAVHPRRNIITQVLDGKSQVEPRGDIFNLDISADDILLLATDGLHGMVPDASIAARLGSGGLPEQIADALVDDALSAGGNDNVTVIVVTPAGSTAPRIDPDTEPSVAESTPAGKRMKRAILLLLFVIPFLVILTFVYILPQFNPGPGSTLDSLGVSDTLLWQPPNDSAAAYDNPDSSRSSVPSWERGDDSVRVGDTLDLL